MDKTLILNKIKNHYNFRKDSELAKHLGISPQTLSNWKKRNSYDPQLIYTKCSEINPEWLLTGEEPMLKKEYINKSKLSIVEDSENNSISIQNIPLYNLEADGGLKNVLKKIHTKTVTTGYIKIPNLANCDGATYVKGNSMFPLLKNGDIVIFKGIPLEDLFWGEIYLMEIALDDKSSFLTIKYLHKSESGEEFIKLVSENSNYDPKDIHINKIKAVALIHASIRLH